MMTTLRMSLDHARGMWWKRVRSAESGFGPPGVIVVAGMLRLRTRSLLRSRTALSMTSLGWCGSTKQGERIVIPSEVEESLPPAMRWGLVTAWCQQAFRWRPLRR